MYVSSYPFPFLEAYFSLLFLQCHSWRSYLSFIQCHSWMLFLTLFNVILRYRDPFSSSVIHGCLWCSFHRILPLYLMSFLDIVIPFHPVPFLGVSDVHSRVFLTLFNAILGYCDPFYLVQFLDNSDVIFRFGLINIQFYSWMLLMLFLECFLTVIQCYSWITLMKSSDLVSSISNDILGFFWCIFQIFFLTSSNAILGCCVSFHPIPFLDVVSLVVFISVQCHSGMYMMFTLVFQCYSWMSYLQLSLSPSNVILGCLKCFFP